MIRDVYIKETHFETVGAVRKEICSPPGETFRITSCKRSCRVCHCIFLWSLTKSDGGTHYWIQFFSYLPRFLSFLVLWFLNLGHAKCCWFSEYSCFRSHITNLEFKNSKLWTHTLLQFHRFITHLKFCPAVYCLRSERTWQQEMAN